MSNRSTNSKALEVPKNVLFESSDDSTYSILALIYTKVATSKKQQGFILFAEKKTRMGDASETYLVIKCGIHNLPSGSVSWKDELIQERLLKEDGKHMINPCPVFDEKENTIFLFYNQDFVGSEEEQMKEKDYSKIFYITSDDYGREWSTAKDISRVLSSETDPHCRLLSPGHGMVEAESGTMFVPAYVKNDAKNNRPKWFYICREGENQLYIQACSTVVKVRNMIKVPEENLLEWSRAKFRLEMQMLNIGAEFEVVVDRGHPFRNIRRVSFPQNYPYQKPILFSKYNGTPNESLAIHVTNDLKEWSKPLIIYKGSVRYSDLALCDDNKTFGIVFQTGDKPEKIMFSFCKVEEVLQNKQ